MFRAAFEPSSGSDIELEDAHALPELIAQPAQLPGHVGASAAGENCFASGGILADEFQADAAACAGDEDVHG
jgi:hypothetical protein